MKIGDKLEMAIWLSGKETEQDRTRWEADVCKEAERIAQANDVLLGVAEFTVKRPGEDRVPQVPNHISGPDVQLLVMEIPILGVRQRVVSRQTGFVHDLVKEDLEKLRRITRRAHARAMPGHRLHDYECDQIIERLGPDTAAKTLRADAKLN